jgi:hypothetical protein
MFSFYYREAAVQDNWDVDDYRAWWGLNEGKRQNACLCQSAASTCTILLSDRDSLPLFDFL